MNTTNSEPLLTPDDNRFVMFPIQHDDIWQMYKKQVDCFWRAEEIDLTKDITHWKSLNDDEKFFISMILAFFAASDGIVLENLAMRFMNDVQLSEARAFYGFQIAMENIHCVTGETKILTDTGYHMIQELENKRVNVWNGEEFSNVEVKYTGNQEIYRITLSNGMTLDCSPGHKWLIQQNSIDNTNKCINEEIETTNLKNGDIIGKYKTPFISFENNMCEDFSFPYIHGFFCGVDSYYDNGCPVVILRNNKKDLLPYFKYNNYEVIDDDIRFYITNYVNKEKYFVPINYPKMTRLNWLSGLFDAQGCTVCNMQNGKCCIEITSDHLDFLKNVQLLLTTLGIQAIIVKNECNNILRIMQNGINKLFDLGFSPKSIEIGIFSKEYMGNENNNGHDGKDNNDITVVEITKISENEKTYCFNEPIKHRGIFNGILTCQSETYSLLIETYIKDKKQKNRFFNAIENYEFIKKKSDWAQKWIRDKESNFATRLIAFASVEGIFFSGSFCSIYWLKKRGLMPGLTFSNELISRDEALHCEFAVLLYSKLVNKLEQEQVHNIIKEAVEIESEFICNALPCRLIGMNSEMMTQYIQFVADRLCLQLGYDKIYSVSNCFPWMELISLESKTNFFEKRNDSYSLANKNMNDEVFNMDENF